MEHKKLLKFHPDTKEYVNKIYNVDKAEEAVKTLQEWLKTQDHFTKKEYNKRYLESLLIDTDGSIEKAKDKLEKRCIFRTLLPHFFNITDFNAEFGEALADTIVGFPLPQLTKEHYRLMLFKAYNTEYFRNVPILIFYKLMFLMTDFIKLHDRCAGYIHLFDLREVSKVDIISKIKPQEFKQYATYYFELQNIRVMKIIYISSSKTITSLVKLMSSLYDSEISEKIEIYEDMKDIVHIIPREMWPIEFGGTEFSARENQDNWIKTASSNEFLNYYNDISNARIDKTIKKIDTNDTFAEMAASIALDFD